MGLRDVKSELKLLDKETLIKHISELYKKYKPVKDRANSYFYIFYKRRCFALLSMTAFDLKFAMNQNDFVILNIVKNL